MDPIRALPVPFCLHGFFPPPLTSALVLPLCDPCLLPSNCHTTTLCRMSILFRFVLVWFCLLLLLYNCYYRGCIVISRYILFECGLLSIFCCYFFFYSKLPSKGEVHEN